MTTHRCSRCGRPLTDPKSIARGMGPVCAKKAGESGSGNDHHTASPLPPGDFHDQPLEGAPPPDESVVLSRPGNEGRFPATNVPHYAVRHSPDGYEWGYGGSGPTDLAMNVVEHFVRQMDDLEAGDTKPAQEGRIHDLTDGIYNFFLREVIASLPREGATLPAADIRSWIRQKTKSLSTQHAHSNA